VPVPFFVFSAYLQTIPSTQNNITITNKNNRFVFKTFCRKYSWSENFKVSLATLDGHPNTGIKKVYVTTCLHNHTLARDVLLFWVVEPRMLVVVSKRFRNAYRSPLQRSSSPRRNLTYVNNLNETQNDTNKTLVGRHSTRSRFVGTASFCPPPCLIYPSFILCCTSAHARTHA